VKATWLLALVLVAPTAQAKEHSYEKGRLVSMESVACGFQEKDGKSIGGEILGTDSGQKKTHELLCQEYTLQAQHILYRIRPTDEKHPALLPIGEVAEFRLDKDKMRLRVPEGDSKEREYAVMSMTQHDDDAKTSATANGPNGRSF